MQIERRTVIKGLVAASAACLSHLAAPPRAAAEGVLTKPIHSTGEKLPLVGLGSWITFNVGEDVKLRDNCAAVMEAFFDSGGRLIDCSPMYGSSQATIGYGLKKLGYPDGVFSAEKVWISSASNGPEQIAQSRAYWGVPRFDLLQVHNLLSWESHLETLRAMKSSGQLRYIGVTTSHGRRHEDIERILSSEDIDFVQVTYNVIDRQVEDRILPLARERGIAVIINRPFRGGALTDKLAAVPLPIWVAETGAASWPQFLLKFIISHPAVTCAIPATTQVDHVRENMLAATGHLPDQTLRQRMADYVAQL
jgi:diketogulonate reductase-like aldo/keto reductase